MLLPSEYQKKLNPETTYRSAYVAKPLEQQPRDEAHFPSIQISGNVRGGRKRDYEATND